MTTINTLKAIVGARALIKSGGWTSHSWARNKFGIKCSPFDPGAMSFCAEGAIMYMARSYDSDPALACKCLDTLDELSYKSFKMNIHEVNDTLGRDVVIDIMDKAIDQLTEEQKAICERWNTLSKQYIEKIGNVPTPTRDGVSRLLAEMSEDDAMVEWLTRESCDRNADTVRPGA